MEHIEIPAGERHPPHNWSFANEAARLAATVDAEGVDCVALQRDTHDYWRLVSVGPPVWQRINAGAASGGKRELIASAALSGHQVIAADGNGQAAYASADDLADVLRVVGVSTHAAALGASILVETNDVLEHGAWAWTPGDVVFLGINGAIVSAVPPGAAFSQVVGRALSATRILVGIQPPIVL